MTTQETVLAAIQALHVYDFHKYGATHVRPKDVAWAAQVSYETARRSLVQLAALGLVKKADPRVEWGVGRSLLYTPAWDTSGPRYATEYDERMSHSPDYYLFGIEDRIDCAKEQALLSQ